MNRPVGWLRRSACFAIHLFNTADATAARTTPAAIGRPFRALMEAVRARDLVLEKLTFDASGRCTTARSSERCCTAIQQQAQRFVPIYLCEERVLSSLARKRPLGDRPCLSRLAIEFALSANLFRAVGGRAG